ncbi:hypothetical protein PC129_g15066 [Phytophthora cactorum]|uniref:Uncharacterized protein n=1 Tax=Phytophthora cactorum TaxID=29920 RepID=A0A8T1KYD6_9STRA|nr:hypothetical protein PC113_g16643 [Phytophthora cactorum]KAG2924372.1 hypothetical protein PC114_g4482 [Phytophthora cactorum]KAG2944177.1 hypothetical protein PC117_g9173 [Phytophthora cactorum]KAG3084117.1 hypothetical protein PC121_g5479 [Phytophthora cactorum]KAG3144785.1 hypothetical protein C6341_g18637 [Phytophthora cactorum]
MKHERQAQMDVLALYLLLQPRQRKREFSRSTYSGMYSRKEHEASLNVTYERLSCDAAKNLVVANAFNTMLAIRH